jgi:hypothetical protein
VIALRQINRRGDRGRGMAIAGIILGSIWMLLVVLLIVVGAQSDESSTTGAGRPDGTLLRVGEGTVGLDPGRSTWAAGDRSVAFMLHYPADRTGRVLPV